jgi:hypothetical protein
MLLRNRETVTKNRSDKQQQMSGHCIFAGVLLPLVRSVFQPVTDSLGYFLDRFCHFPHHSIRLAFLAQSVVIGRGTGFSYLATLQFIHLACH